jgi:hypothetical protein
MRLLFHTFRAAVATGLSLWLAVLACLVGCTLPRFSDSATSIQENADGYGQSALMAGMENCPHHSSGNAPARQNGPKPVQGGRMSCCPVEVTVASKPAMQHIAPASDFGLESDFSLVTIPFFHRAEFVSPVSHSGRDTLLETHLLRV